MSIPVPSAPANYERFKIKQNGNWISNVPRHINLGNGFSISENALQNRLDIAISGLTSSQLADNAVTTNKIQDDAVTAPKIGDLAAPVVFNNNTYLQGKKSTGTAVNLIGMHSLNILDIGQNNDTGIAEVDIKCGTSLAPFQILRTDGFLRCGGVNRRVIISETGLDAQRTFTFPNADAKLIGENAAMTDGANIVLGTTTGSKIGTATNQRLGFFNATPVVQPLAVADATGGATVDAEARTAINTLIARLETLGLIAT